MWICPRGPRCFTITSARAQVDALGSLFGALNFERTRVFFIRRSPNKVHNCRDADAEASQATAPDTRKVHRSSLKVTSPCIRRLRGLFSSTLGCRRGQSCRSCLGPKITPCVCLSPSSHEDFSRFNLRPVEHKQAPANTAPTSGLRTHRRDRPESGPSTDSNSSSGESPLLLCFISRAFIAGPTLPKKEKRKKGSVLPCGAKTRHHTSTLALIVESYRNPRQEGRPPARRRAQCAAAAAVVGALAQQQRR